MSPVLYAGSPETVWASIPIGLVHISPGYILRRSDKSSESLPFVLGLLESNHLVTHADEYSTEKKNIKIKKNYPKIL